MFTLVENPNTVGTSNISHELTKEDRAFVETLTINDVRKKLGTKCELYEPEMEYKGYESEWYFMGDDGKLYGIGFRWGTARIRGNFDFGEDVSGVQLFANYLKEIFNAQTV